MTKQYFDCACGTPSHTFSAAFFDDEKDMLYIETQLAGRPFLRRLVVAAKYVVGYKSKFGDGAWEETALTPSQAVDLRKFIDAFLA